MNAPLVKAVALTIGSPFEGGFYAGDFRIGDTAYALIVAPKAEGELKDVQWHDNYTSVEGALSYCDGLANTDAMAAAGSTLAKQVRELRIGGFDDWYLPSQDELEILYRNLKPTDDENSLYARSGVNVSAIDPTYPYTSGFPLQTKVEAFITGGAEAFADNYYWTSTQHAGYADYAWCQFFEYGGQSYYRKDYEHRARAVRRLAI
jgi:hypothetical protein